MKSLIDKIKAKIKQIAAKIAGLPQPPDFATIYIIKNGEEVFNIDSTSRDISYGICTILQYFSKYDNYKIIYNYSNKEIYIYFTVKKGNELDLDTGETKK